MDMRSEDVKNFRKIFDFTGRNSLGYYRHDFGFSTAHITLRISITGLRKICLGLDLYLNDFLEVSVMVDGGKL